MASPTIPRPSRSSRWFDLAVVLGGLAIAFYCLATAALDGLQMSGLALLAVPLVVVVARFPMVLDDGEGGIEVGFDSSVLMFLLCTLPPVEALLLWSMGVITTQVLTQKRPSVKLFNIGVGILGGAGSAVLLDVIRGPEGAGHAIELLAVAVAATGYFASDFLITALSITLETRSTMRRQLVQRGTLVAVACFVPYDSLGYLGAVIGRDAPWWTLLLLAVPLVTLLVATRAVTRGGENSRRLHVLFAAAVRAQTLSDTRQVVDALIDDARQLLRIDQVQLRSTPPTAHEIGARLHDGQRDQWIVAPGKQRARSTMTADQQALEALVAVSSDAFGRLRLTEEMTHLARHDVLTSLPNRGLLLDRMQHSLQLSQRRGGRIALLFVDLDGFKPVNDRFGHAAGDSVLVDVAHRLGSCVRQSDTVARLGGDEFALLLEDVTDGDVEAATERILASLSHGVDVAGHRLPLSASVGVTFSELGETAESLLRNADLAMYEAKARGKNQAVRYERAIGDSRMQRLELVEALRSSIDHDELELVYQPVSSAATGHITGVEALARWRLDGVDVRPDVFIHVAEESGLIVALGEVVLQRAARDFLRIREVVSDDLNISVNVSPKQLREPGFVASVESALARMGVPRLILELTERDGIGQDEASLAAMARLTAAGVPLAIDDFGVGFSSIGYLQNMPIRIIKTDLSFSANIDTDERACALLCSITMMGQALGLDVVVEGIERPSQLQHLRDHVHAPYAQGYLLHRPMSLERLLEVLRDNQTEQDGYAEPLKVPLTEGRPPASARAPR